MTPAEVKALLISNLKEIADYAEVQGDRTSMVRALRMAWKIEFRAPVEPMPMSHERMNALAERLLLNNVVAHDVEELTNAIAQYELRESVTKYKPHRLH